MADFAPSDSPAIILTLIPSFVASAMFSLAISWYRGCILSYTHYSFRHSSIRDLNFMNLECQ